MRKMLLVLTLAGAAMIAPGLTPAAHAYGWFSAGVGFHVGPLSLSFVLGQPFANYGPGYYYRANAPIAYPGYQCTDRCFVDHGVYYHDRACPVVRHYLAEYQVDPYDLYVQYAPRYGSYYDGGYFERHGGYFYGGGGYYGGYDRRYANRGYYDRGYAYRGYYDRGYDNRGYDRREDRRDEGRGYDGRAYDSRGYDRRGDPGRQETRRQDYGRQDGGRRDYRQDRAQDRGGRGDGGQRGQRGGGGNGGHGSGGHGGSNGHGGQSGHGDHGDHHHQ